MNQPNMGATAPPPGAKTANRDTTQADATDQSGSGDKMIPKERLDEVISQRDEARSQAEKAAQERAELQRNLSQVMHTMAQTQADATRREAEARNKPTNVKEVPQVQVLRQRFGPGQEGEEAYNAVVDTVAATLEAMGNNNGAPVDQQAMMQEITKVIDQRFNALNSTMRTNQRIENWKKVGMVDDAGAQKIYSRMKEYIDYNPQNASNMDVLANTVYTELAEKGQISVGGRDTTVPPLTPGSGGGGVPPSNTGIDPQTTVNKFPSLRGLSPERIAQLEKISGVSLSEPEEDIQLPEVLHGSYRGGV